MAEQQPKIRARRTTRLSPWVAIIEREVTFADDAPPEIYHAIGQQDYLAIVAQMPDGRIPIVRQYRPALEAYTWELPAGLLDAGEEPASACARELKEETGLTARTVHALGSFAPCTARLSNRVHSFYVETDGSRGKPAETGIDMNLVTVAELAELIRAGDFVLQLHLGAILLAGMAGHFDLGAFGPAVRR